MNARLLVINPQQAAELPVSPTLVLEQQGNILLYSAGWPYLVKPGALETITPEDFRNLPGIGTKDQVYLSDIRALPNGDLKSAEVIAWIRKWWAEFVAERVEPEHKTPSLKMESQPRSAKRKTNLDEVLNK
jgi:hypothetical protein